VFWGWAYTDITWDCEPNKSADPWSPSYIFDSRTVENYVGQTSTDVQFPVWLLCAAASLPCALGFVSKRKWVAGKGECRKCGYPLSERMTCPECGTPIAPTK
jgi:hypothetical protein